MIASDILDSAAAELNDLEPGFEYTRWTRPEMLGYLTDAVAQLAALKPTLFETTTVLPLGPGAMQKLPEYVAVLEDVIFNLNVDGSLGAPILPSDFNLERTYGKGTPTTTPYAVRSFSVHPKTDAVYYVDPPVPPTNGTVRVQAVVQLAPQQFTTMDTPIELPSAAPEVYRNAMKDWVLYRAFAKDTESQVSSERSQAHFKAFYQFMGSPTRNKDALPIAETEKRNAARAG